MPWDMSPLVLLIGVGLWPFISKILPDQTRPINKIISKHLTVSIVVMYYFLVKMSEFIPSISPMFLSTSFGVLLSASITRDQTKNRQKLDEDQKRDRVIESLLLEINTHTEPLNRLEEVLTFSFDGIIASGLYILLPPESQEIVSSYYQGCHQVNNYNRGGRTITQQQVNKIQYVQKRLLREIEPVIKNLENLRS